MTDFNQAKRRWVLGCPSLHSGSKRSEFRCVGNGFLEPHETTAIFNAWGRLRLTVF